MNIKTLFSFCIIMSLFALSALAQPLNPKEFKNTGDQQFENGKYLQALKSYLRYQRVKPEDLEVKKKIGICYFQVNNTQEAEKYIQYVFENSKKIDPDAYLQMALIKHAQGAFESASQFYKKFLRTDPENQNLRKGVRDNIKRCRVGEKIKSGSPIAQVENLGENINTQWDEFKPVLSPNNPDKIYFSSSRDSCLGGLRNEKGILDELKGFYSSDMFASGFSNGSWGKAVPMTYLLNSPRFDVLEDFNSDGTVMYFFQGFSINNGDIFTDTFRLNVEERSLFSPRFNCPIMSKDGDKDLYFFNDTTLFFSSLREGGFGGYDLYYSFFTKGKWSLPQNLGPEINTEFDEVSPFLAKNGRNLYFASNGLNSIGGLDIFRSVYNETTKKWESTENLGIPINSAGDDFDMRIDEDGSRAYFTSSRVQSIGGKDIFVAYFRDTRDEMVQIDPMQFFYLNSLRNYVHDTPASMSSSNDVDDQSLSPDQKRRESTIPSDIVERQATTKNEKNTVKTTMISPLFYKDESDVISAQNMQILLQVKNIYLNNPSSKIELIIHTENTGQNISDAFFGVKKADQAAKYLIKNGIPANIITVKSVGSAYPYAMPIVGSNPNPVAERLNKRIDIFFGSTSGENKNFPTLNIPIIGDDMRTSEGEYYLGGQKGLTYRLQVAAVKGLYNDNVLTEYPDLMIEMSPENNVHKYMLGRYRTYASAEQLKGDLEKKGYKGSFIIPYVNGIRINGKDEAKTYTDQYSDLNFYINK